MARNTKLKTIGFFETYEENPFIDKITITKRKKTIRAVGQKTDTFVNNTTGEVVGHSTFATIQEVDEEKFLKLYLGNLKMFFELRNTDLKVLMFLMQELPINSDVVRFDSRKCMAYTGIKSN